MRAMLLVATALATSASCYSPALSDCELQCGTGNSCPAGLKCNSSGTCRDPDATGPCPVQPIDAALIDSPLDAPSFWAIPQEVSGIGVGFQDPTLTADMTQMYLSRQGSIQVATYNTAAGTWTAPTGVAEIAAVGSFTAPFISFDGLTLYVSSSTANSEILRCVRTAGNPTWMGLNPIAELNSNLPESGGAMTADGRNLALSSTRNTPPTFDLFETTLESGAWRPPIAMAILNDPVANDSHAVFDASGLRVVFASDRGGNLDLYTSTRATRTSAFAPPQPIAELNTPVAESDPWLSPDGTTLYFARGATAVSRIMRSVRTP